MQLDARPTWPQIFISSIDIFNGCESWMRGSDGYAFAHCATRISSGRRVALLARRCVTTELCDFLALSYDELEQLNLEAKEQRKDRVVAQNNPGRSVQISNQREADQGGGI